MGKWVRHIKSLCSLVGLEVREEAVIPLVEKVPEGVLLHQEA